MRTIKKIHDAQFALIADLITYSPLPSDELQQIDPFIFLNHHGYQRYKPDNNGLPFGPHPHRGMETVTFILKGDILHRDSGGHESVITAGGIQWMTAGRGLIHTETSSDNFKRIGGDLEILQLWINLPARLKMTEPKYFGIQENEIPSLLLDNNKIQIQIISGNWENKSGAINSQTEINLFTIYFEKDSEIETSITTDNNIFFYLVKGILNVNGSNVNERQLVEFENDDDQLIINAVEKSILILGYTKPFNEPVVAQGPFVMNTQEEIAEAYRDYRTGKFGKWMV